MLKLIELEAKFASSILTLCTEFAQLNSKENFDTSNRWQLFFDTFAIRSYLPGNKLIFAGSNFTKMWLETFLQVSNFWY